MSERREGLTPLEREQWLLGEQSEAERVRCEAHLDDQLREQLVREDGELRAQLFARLPPSEFVDRVLASAGRSAVEPARAGKAWMVPTLVATLAALTIGVFAGLKPELTHESERAKGLELELRVYRQRSDGAEQLSDGTEVRPHDLLQLAYIRGEYAFGVLLSIDGRGGVTLHHPPVASGTSALASEAGQHLLPESYELDDAPSFERFIFVVANQPLSVPDVEAAARALAKDRERARHDPLLLSVRTAQRSLLLNKSSTR